MFSGVKRGLRSKRVTAYVRMWALNGGLWPFLGGKNGENDLFYRDYIGTHLLMRTCVMPRVGSVWWRAWMVCEWSAPGSMISHLFSLSMTACELCGMSAIHSLHFRHRIS